MACNLGSVTRGGRCPQLREAGCMCVGWAGLHVLVMPVSDHVWWAHHDWGYLGEIYRGLW